MKCLLHHPENALTARLHSENAVRVSAKDITRIPFVPVILVALFFMSMAMTSCSPYTWMEKHKQEVIDKYCQHSDSVVKTVEEKLVPYPVFIKADTIRVSEKSPCPDMKVSAETGKGTVSYEVKNGKGTLISTQKQKVDTLLVPHLKTQIQVLENDAKTYQTIINDKQVEIGILKDQYKRATTRLIIAGIMDFVFFLIIIFLITGRIKSFFTKKVT